MTQEYTEEVVMRLMEIYQSELIKARNSLDYEESTSKYNALAAYCTYATLGGPRDVYFESTMQNVLPEALINLAANRVGLSGKSKDSAICELAIMCISCMQLVDMQLTFSYSKEKMAVTINRQHIELGTIAVNTGNSRERATRKWFDDVVASITTYIHYMLNAEQMPMGKYNKYYAEKFRSAYLKIETIGDRGRD